MPKGIYKRKPFSNEWKEKISLAKKGNKCALGHKHTEEAKRKMSEAKKGKKLPPFSEEHKRKMSEANKGKPLSLENRKSFKSYWESLKGRHHSEETKKRMSEAHKGEKSYLWQGGKSFESYSTDWTETLRRSIRERDNYICQLCGKTQIEELEEIERKLSIHHIDYDKKNCNPNNLITFCVSCNSKVNKNRDYWINYFTKI